MRMSVMQSMVLAGACAVLPGWAMAGKAPITDACVAKAQEEWGKAIVAIGAAHTNPEADAKAAAQDVLDRLYDFGRGPVLFKPTVATDPQFRTNEKDALSYFVTGHISEDQGFALKPWTNVRFENNTVRTFGDVALAMGNYYFTCSEGNTIKVEYTKGYVRDDTGNLRIVLQHSSLPFTPPAKATKDGEKRDEKQAEAK